MDALQHLEDAHVAAAIEGVASDVSLNGSNMSQNDGPAPAQPHPVAFDEDAI